MTISRREVLKTLAATPVLLHPGSSGLQAGDPATLAAIAETVLPAEADRKAAVAAFASWIDSYKEGADTDHGYGVTRVRATGPSPSANYAAQVAALDAAARATGAAGFAAASLERRRAIVEAA